MKYVLIIALLFTCAPSRAQVNLVMNSSLEQYDSCPFRNDEIKFAAHWNSLDSGWSPPDWTHDLEGVPEYCNACAFRTPYGVPSTGLWYYQYPHTGSGMAQVEMFFNDADTTVEYKRDYLQGHLRNTLTAGQSYCVTFWVSLEHASEFAINNIGAYLDNGTIDTTHKPDLIQTQFTPQVLATSVISDTLNWVKIEGSFIANGTERLITIGNFTDKYHTTYVPAPGKDTTGTYLGDSYSWYLVDDISVIKSSAVASAGPDRTITSPHDTVMVGDTSDNYLPCYWYVSGVVVDSNKGGFMIHVDTTTTFVMALDVCGHITYDTAVVVASYELENIQTKFLNAEVYPNPAATELTVAQAAGAQLSIYDVLGREIYRANIVSDKQQLDISPLTDGIYTVAIISRDGERKKIKLIKK